MDASLETEVLKYLKALVYIQAQSFTPAEETPKPEVILARAGLGSREIADLLGKKLAAVQKTLERSRKAS